MRERKMRKLQEKRGDSRDSWAAGRWEDFKADWVAKHGHAAAKELYIDSKRDAPGPTWTSAHPTPFKVISSVEKAPMSPSVQNHFRDQYGHKNKVSHKFLVSKK